MKLVHLVGLIIKKFVTMNMNVKKKSLYLCIKLQGTTSQMTTIILLLYSNCKRLTLFSYSLIFLRTFPALWSHTATVWSSLADTIQSPHMDSAITALLWVLYDFILTSPTLVSNSMTDRAYVPAATRLFAHTRDTAGDSHLKYTTTVTPLKKKVCTNWDLVRHLVKYTVIPRLTRDPANEFFG